MSKLERGKYIYIFRIFQSTTKLSKPSQNFLFLINVLHLNDCTSGSVPKNVSAPKDIGKFLKKNVLEVCL